MKLTALAGGRHRAPLQAAAGHGPAVSGAGTHAGGVRAGDAGQCIVGGGPLPAGRCLLPTCAPSCSTLPWALRGCGWPAGWTTTSSTNWPGRCWGLAGAACGGAFYAGIQRLQTVAGAAGGGHPAARRDRKIFAVVLVFSHIISLNHDRMRSFAVGVLPFALVLGVVAALMLLEPHLSGTLLILGIGAVLMFVGGTGLRWFVLAGVGGAAAIGGGGGRYAGPCALRCRPPALLEEPLCRPAGDGHQTIQSLYAIGSGGATGLGLGEQPPETSVCA